ncbi:MAG TPA: hypothetical protein VNT50_13715 [Microbacterium sp.]|nr:hypothetical protein [Microbacterium sp.]
MGSTVTVVAVLAMAGVLWAARAVAISDTVGVPAGSTVVVPSSGHAGDSFTNAATDVASGPSLVEPDAQAPGTVSAPAPSAPEASDSASRPSEAPVVVPPPAPVEIDSPAASQVRHEIEQRIPGEVDVDRTWDRKVDRWVRSRDIPQTPANAGSPSGHGSPSPLSGFEGEQSRVFPDRRD